MEYIVPLEADHRTYVLRTYIYLVRYMEQLTTHIYMSAFRIK